MFFNVISDASCVFMSLISLLSLSCARVAVFPGQGNKLLSQHSSSKSKSNENSFSKQLDTKKDFGPIFRCTDLALG